jgi:SAM-dependent methyltransferase
MANFPPYKAYIVASLDELIARHALSDPFLDFGCGRGDVALHLARRGWRGTALDSSTEARALAEGTLAPYPGVRVRASVGDERFETIVMLDVLEHLADDRGALVATAALQVSGGALVLTVPTHPEREWRWDDEMYGHLRRYRPEDLVRLLADTGYRVTEMWEISYPAFWLLRRGFTAMKHPPVIAGTPEERTALSVTVDAWDLGIVSKVLSVGTLWRPVFALQRRFRHDVRRGSEVMILARRAPNSEA